LVEREWAGEMDLGDLAPSALGDPVLLSRIATFFRRSASPGAASALFRMNSEMDTRAVLPTIAAPTLVLCREGDRDVSAAESRWIAGQIPHGRYVELPGADHLPWIGDVDRLLDEVEVFLTGVRRAPDPDRRLATVLFTDIVGSTQRAAELGDGRWRQVLAEHHAIVREQIHRFGGREIDTAGDGFLVAFNSAARAVRCAVAVRDHVGRTGLEVRSGVHAGESEESGGKLIGIALHIGSRLLGLARPGEVLVSSTVRDLVTGSGIEFDDRGEHTLKGISGHWHLYAARTG
jgi:class 3 adenylate cyclase